jgi:hypothetical protein
VGVSDELPPNPNYDDLSRFIGGIDSDGLVVA